MAGHEPDATPTNAPADEQPGSPFLVVGVGASAGGLEAYTELLEALPANPGLALLLVSHLDPDHKSHLPEILGRVSKMPVREVAEGMTVEVDHVYVIPPGTSMALIDGHLTLSPRPPRPVPHMPIDHLFRSLAGHPEEPGRRRHPLRQRQRRGHRPAGDQGGRRRSPSPRTRRPPEYPSMPRAAVRTATSTTSCGRATSPASWCGSPATPTPGRTTWAGRLLPRRSATRSSRSSTCCGPAPASTSPTTSRPPSAAASSGGWPCATCRRPANTSHSCGATRPRSRTLPGLPDPRHPVLPRPGGVRGAQGEGLPGHSSRTAPAAHPIRIWVAGCATGEEVYSLAICLLEFLDERAEHPAVKILATDLNEAALEKARAGVYLDNIEIDVSAERLRRFFVRTDGHYQISKAVRDLCVFSRHNMATDPPFSRIDLVSCRNVLIYMDAALQKRVLPLLHYALNPDGFLFLGSSENIGAFTDLFEVVDAKHRIFAKQRGGWARRSTSTPPSPPTGRPAADRPRGGARRSGPRWTCSGRPTASCLARYAAGRAWWSTRR